MSSYKSSSILPSPRFFIDFSAKDSEAAAMSPNSILKTKPFSPVMTHFFTEKVLRKPLPWDHRAESMSVGLGIVDDLVPDRRASSPKSRMVLFGSRLKIQIPYVTVEAPQSPVEFGVKNKSAQLGLLSPAVRSPRFLGNVVATPPSVGVFSACLAAEEMELSEDYTKVVANGPNARTTHIFENCIVESHGLAKNDKNFASSPMDTDDPELENLVTSLQMSSIHEGTSTTAAQVTCNTSWKHVLLGKVDVTERLVRFKTLHSTLLSIWSKFGVRSISQVQKEIFMAEFDSVNGLDRVIDEGPWNFQNGFLLI